MTCTKTEDDVVAYCLNTLPAEKHAEMTEHFSSCPRCRKLLDAYRATQSLLDAWQPARPPEGLREPVIAAVRRELVQGADKNAGAVPDGADIAGALLKAVTSEQLRVYKFLTGYLGSEQGGDAFERYLEEQSGVKLTDDLTYIDLLTKLYEGDELTITRSNGETTEHITACPFVDLADDIKFNGNPCETICRRQINVIERLKSVKIDHITLSRRKKGTCMFHSRPKSGDV